jgi:hypothetical protein
MLVRICAPRGSYPGAIGTNLSMLFGEVPFLERFGRASEAGLGNRIPVSIRGRHPGNQSLSGVIRTPARAIYSICLPATGSKASGVR